MSHIHPMVFALVLDVYATAKHSGLDSSGIPERAISRLLPASCEND